MFDHKTRPAFGSIFADEDEQPTHRPWFSTSTAADADPPPRSTGSAAAAATMVSGMYDGPTVQRDEAGALDGEALSPRELVPAGGSTLDGGLRREMEQRLGAGFAGVRVHEDAGRARAMNANAYTVGEDIVFDAGRFDPGSVEGRHRLAHELAHVVQQRAGQVSGTPVGNGVNLSDPSDSHERAAHDAADRAMGGAPPAASAAAVSGGGLASGGGAATVQREEADGGGEGIYDKIKKKVKDYLGDAKRLGKVAGPVIAGAEGLVNIGRADDATDRVLAAEQGLKKTVGAIGGLAGEPGEKLAEAGAQKLIDYKRKVFPFQGEIDASGTGISGDVTGGNPSTDAPRDAAGNIAPNDSQIVTDSGDIIDRRTGEVVNAGDDVLSEARKKELDEGTPAGE